MHIGNEALIVLEHFFFAVKKNSIISFADRWMELEIIILNELTKTQTSHATCSATELTAVEIVETPNSKSSHGNV